jgi:hypothetical protein
MKQCPTCRNTYTDDALNFCLADGSALELYRPEEATVVFSQPGNSNRIAVPAKYRTTPAKQVANPLMIPVVAVFLLVAVIAVVGFIYIANRQTNVVTEATPKQVPAQTPLPDDEAAKLRGDIANLQKQVERQKAATPAVNVQSVQPSSGGTVAWAYSPGDGFLALRSQPSSEAGTRITKIPHGAQIAIGSCQEYILTARGNRGRWCTATYAGYSGWVFDAFVRY